MKFETSKVIINRTFHTKFSISKFGRTDQNKSKGTSDSFFNQILQISLYFECYLYELFLE